MKQRIHYLIKEGFRFEVVKDLLCGMANGCAVQTCDWCDMGPISVKFPDPEKYPEGVIPIHVHTFCYDAAKDYFDHLNPA